MAWREAASSEVDVMQALRACTLSRIRGSFYCKCSIPSLCSPPPLPGHRKLLSGKESVVRGALSILAAMSKFFLVPSLAPFLAGMDGFPSTGEPTAGAWRRS